MRMLLKYEKLWDYVDGTIDVDHEDYDMGKDIQALSLIGLGLDPSIQYIIEDEEYAKNAWEVLAAKYLPQNNQGRCALLGKLTSIHQSDFKNMEEYTADFIITVQKLKEINFKVDDQIVACLMLNNVTDPYEVVAMTIDSTCAELSTDLVQKRLIAEEQRRLNRESSSETVLAAHAKFRPKKEGGKPPAKQEPLECGYCHKLGHIKRNCYARQRAEEAKSSNHHQSKPHHTKNNDNKKDEKTKVNLLLTALGASHQDRKDSFFIDSGASCHLISNKEWFSVFNEKDSGLSVTLPDDSNIQSGGSGNVKLQFSDGEKTLTNAVYVPNLGTNLISVSKMTEKNLAVVFVNNKCEVFHRDDFQYTGTVQFDAELKNDLYKLNATPVKGKVCNGPVIQDQVVSKTDQHSSCHTLEVDSPEKLEAWHSRMGHLNKKDLQQLCKQGSFGADVWGNLDGACDACQKGKQCRNSFPQSEHIKVDDKLGLIHADVCGPFREESLLGNRYMLTFLDDHTRKIFPYFLRSKDQVASKFIEFKAFVENQSDKKIKILRTDCGKEFVNSKMEAVCKEAGILQQKTCGYDPESNGRSERINRTICERARCMISEAGCPANLWDDACRTAVHLINRSPHSSLGGKIPEFEWLGSPFSLKYLRTFGCKVYVYIPKCKRGKTDPKSFQGMFLGYSDESKGFRILDLRDNSICISRNVRFFEQEKCVFEGPCEEDVFYLDFLSRKGDVQPAPQVALPRPENVMGDDLSSSNSDSEPDVDNISTSTDGSLQSVGSRASDYFPSSANSSDSNEAEIEPAILPRRSERARRPNVRLADYIVNTAVASVSNQIIEIPNSIQEALLGPEKHLWRRAVNEELDSIKENGTWVLVEKPNNQKPIQSKWVFSIKTDVGGKPRYKARLVAKGYSQKPGIDFEETFSPVIRRETLRLLFAIAAQYDMDITHMDVKTAFLNGLLSETIYMYQPEACEVAGEEGKVCLLKKALYGLKQSSRVWNLRIHEELTKLGFSQCKKEPCIYFKVQGGMRIYVAIYVDDFLIFSADPSETLRLKKSLMSLFKMEDLGEVKTCLGINVTRDKSKGEIYLDQERFIDDLLSKFSMEDCHSVSTPMEVKFKCDKGSTEIDSNLPYRELIGGLMYLAVNTRPDIAHAVTKLSQYNNCYTEETWKHAKRVLRYLKGTKEKKLVFKKSENPSLIGYVDADWGEDLTDRRSFSGYLFKFGESPLSWCSRKQKSVSLSSTESEYIALSEAAREAVFYQLIFKLLHLGDINPITLYNDNQAAQHLAKNCMFSHKLKHVDIRFEFIRETVREGLVRMMYVNTKNNVADFLTKPVCSDKHIFCSQGSSLV